MTETMAKPVLDLGDGFRKDDVMEWAKLNVYQRKAAVTHQIGTIRPDATHPHHKFEYISYQHLMDVLRPACLAAGLDISTDVVDGTAVITYTNVDSPDDQIIQRFAPVGLPNDQAASYVVKYALMKAFLIGDGEDPDSQEPSRPAVPQEAPRSQPMASPTDLGSCPICQTAMVLTKDGTKVRCSSSVYKDGKWESATGCTFKAQPIEAWQAHLNAAKKGPEGELPW